MQKSKIKDQRFVTLLVAVVIAAALTGCQKQELGQKQDQKAVPVKVMEVKLMDLATTLEYVGSTKAYDEVMVFPKVTGKVIEKLKQEGERVDKNEAIAYVDRDEVGLKFEKAPVESPITGKIGKMYVDIGSSVSPQRPVALAVNLDEIKVNVNIPERYLPKIALAQEAKVRVDAYPQKEFSGAITAISPVVDPLTRAANVEITVDNKEHLLQSGMFVKVILVIEEHKNIPAVLKEAVMGRPPQSWVYVVEDNKAVLRTVELGIRQGAYYEITQGAQEGDMAVIMGQHNLREGAEVIVEQE